ncbi:MAG: signal recognition particle protein [Planctomycetota bacterium]
MFDTLSIGLLSVLDKFRSRGVLTAENIQEGMKSVRLAMLDADVSYKVVKQFIQKVEERAVGAIQVRGVNPGQQIVKIVSDELIAIMGDGGGGIHLQPGLTVVMMAGLQGSGKTTTSGKLARLLLEKYKCKPMLVAADVRRPAAIEQLEKLGAQTGVPVFTGDRKDPVRICEMGVQQAKAAGLDLVILDTSGRLHVDDELMKELEVIRKRVTPHEIILVCDAMTGQDAVKSAFEFNSRLEISGVILTKLDGDARGGAALSVRTITGKPIKYICSGEHLDAIEEFHPDRMASRILGMGDVVSLVEKAQKVVDQEQAAVMAEKLARAEFTLEDFMSQIQQMKKMGPMKDILKMIPGMGKQLKNMDFDEKEVVRIEAMIQSMTKAERLDPDIIRKGRRERIAKGSGTKPADVSRLVRDFDEMRKMMKKLMSGGMKGLGKMLGGGGMPFKR